MKHWQQNAAVSVCAFVESWQKRKCLHIFLHKCVISYVNNHFKSWLPAGLWVGGNEVEDETNHNPSRHDDTGIGQQGGVHCEQAWNEEKC